jgi:Acyl-CoA synthetases (AMP-forming)/AMP-acid ligases II
MIKQCDEVHDVNVVQGWSRTETSPLATANLRTKETEAMPKEEMYKLQTKQGKPVYGVELKIVDDDGKRLPEDGEAFGRLLIRGPWVNKRYYKFEEDAVDADGWFDTGDISSIDPAGSMIIVDRAKDVIKSGGEWISSVDLENVAQGHRDVMQACVIGVAHPKWDERPLLLIVAAGHKKDKECIYSFLEDKIGKWWKPDDIVFVDELPFGATGKVLKVNLRDQFKDHLMK